MSAEFLTPYTRESHAVLFHFGHALQPAWLLKKDPDAARLVQETIEQMEGALRTAQFYHERSKARFLRLAIEGERALLQELTAETRH